MVRIRYLIPLKKVVRLHNGGELAEAFSHKPVILAIDDNNSIVHNGKEYGYLYILNEPIDIDIDIYAHPRTNYG